MGIKISNYFRTTIANSGGITAAATSITLTSAVGLPSLGTGDYCYLTLVKLTTNQKEIVKVSSVTGNVCTIERAQESTTAIAFDQYDLAEMWVTKATLEDLLSEGDDEAYNKAVDAYVLAQSALASAATANTQSAAAAATAAAAQVTANAALPATGGTITGNLTITGALSLPTGTEVQTIATGVISMFASATPPAGWLLLDGSQYEAVGNDEKLRLFDWIKANWATATYIVTDSATSKIFKLPNMAGLVPIGVGTTSGITFGLMSLAPNGSYEVALSSNQLPRHNHSYTTKVFTGAVAEVADVRGPYSFPYLKAVDDAPASTGFAGGSSGSTQLHNNIQPSFGLYFIIKM